MNSAYEPSVEFEELLHRMCEGDLTPTQARRLETIVEEDEDACWHYLCCVHLHGTLHWNLGKEQRLGGAATSKRDTTVHAAQATGEALSTNTSPSAASGFPVNALPNPTGYIASGWPLAYLVATVIFAIGLAVGALVRVSGPTGAEMVRSVQPPAPIPAPIPVDSSAIAHITGMVDCQWEGADAENQKSEIRNHQSLLHLGDRIALKSGLMEVRYYTGARVVLQGPVTYEVEAAAGGYLSAGKLTACLDDHSGIPNQKSQITNPKSFAVRTPTAIVTDLGTEFGVEVDREGKTVSRVFRGAVKFELRDGISGSRGDGLVLHENETAETVKNTGGAGLGIRRIDGATRSFVRHISHAPKKLDLLDIVAGGVGTTGRRERGIDATTGMEDPTFCVERRIGDGRYHPVAWHKFIDGVFTPSGSDGPVQVDSAGHVFSDFPRTSRLTDASIWARAATVEANGREKDYRYWVYAMGDGRQYMPNRSGLLALATDMGITFDLEAMRRVYRGARPSRFRTVAAIADARGLGFRDEVQVADLWILVDGRSRLSHPQLRREDGAIKVDLELGPKDRFLTLASTYGGGPNGFQHNLDWLVLGDPVLEMASGEE